MTDPLRYPDAEPPRTARWVKVFGIIGIVIVLLVGILLLTGGGGHGPGRHSGAAGDVPPSGEQQGAGEVGEPAEASEAARTVEVTALDTAFEPSTIDVSAGEAVTFLVTNTGRAVHEFTVGDAPMQQEHAEAMDHIPSGMAHDTGNSITLQPGETKELSWRFGEAATLEYACHQPGHYEAGMRGPITVA